MQALANRYANVLGSAGVAPEQRVIIALPDGPDYVAALFGILKIGAVVVMVNPELKPDAIAVFLRLQPRVGALVAAERAEAFRAAAGRPPTRRRCCSSGRASGARGSTAAPDTWRNFPTHRDDPAIWLFSGGTTGRPKAAVQPHRSYMNTAQCYARHVLGYTEDDVTLSVPKLYFGYAMGSNLFFPFAAGATSVLFDERCTADVDLRPDRALPADHPDHRPHHGQPDGEPPGRRPTRTSRCVRLATSAGEGLPEELHARWDQLFGVPLLDGLGTAEQWHIFLSNRVGRVRRGTLGEVVPGFEIKVMDEEGRECPTARWVISGCAAARARWATGSSSTRARACFRGEWVVTGDLVRRDADGYYTYGGRADELLKVSGKWLSATEVEGCLLQHPAVAQAAVVGVADANGLVKPHAYVVARERRDGLAEELKASCASDWSRTSARARSSSWTPCRRPTWARWIGASSGRSRGGEAGEPAVTPDSGRRGRPERSSIVVPRGERCHPERSEGSCPAEWLEPDSRQDPSLRSG